MIAGQSPRIIWQDNSDGSVRTIEQAKELARKFGVRIPDDVEFFADDENDLPENITARGPKVTKPSGIRVTWSDLVHPITGKVPFLVRLDILKSDEAIVGVFGHEMYELEAIRKILKKGKTTIDTFIALTCADNPGNLHDEAWDCRRSGRADEEGEQAMTGALMEKYRTGKITDSHLVVEILHMLDPENPGIVLGEVPDEILQQIRLFAKGHVDGRMLTNHGVLPSQDQVLAAKSWIEKTLMQQVNKTA